MSQNSALPRRAAALASATKRWMSGCAGIGAELSGARPPPFLADAGGAATSRSAAAQRSSRRGTHHWYSRSQACVNAVARIMRVALATTAGSRTRVRELPMRRCRIRELELLAAAGAQRVVQLDGLAAARARPYGLVGVVAVQQRCGEPDERQDRRDQEPQQERRALQASDEASGDAEGQGDQHVRH